MKVRILKSPVGLYNLAHYPGEVINLPDAQANELIETGHAEKTDAPIPVVDDSEYGELTGNDGKKFKVETTESRAKKEKQVRR